MGYHVNTIECHIITWQYHAESSIYMLNNINGERFVICLVLILMTKTYNLLYKCFINDRSNINL